jgi:DNA polymerase-3 subunit beta
MKITFRRELLKVALDKLAVVASKGDKSKVITRHVMIAPTGDGATVSAIGETYARLMIPEATIDGESDRFLVPHMPMKKIIDESLDENVDIEAEDNGELVVTFPTSEYRVHTFSKCDPFDAMVPKFVETLDHIDRKDIVEVDANVFVATAERVVYGVPANNERGVLVEVEDGKMRLVSTDGRRVVVAECATLGGGLRTNRAIMIPPSMIYAARKIFLEGNVSFAAIGGTLAVWSSDHVICSSESAGRFPDWRKVVPKGNNVQITVNAEALLKAVKQATSINDGDSTERIRFDVEGGVLRVSAGKDAKARIRVPARVSTGETLFMDLNPKYLVQQLKCVPPTDEVELCAFDKISKLNYGTEFYSVMANMVESSK